MTKIEVLATVAACGGVLAAVGVFDILKRLDALHAQVRHLHTVMLRELESLKPGSDEQE